MTQNEILEGNKLIAEFFTREKFFNHSIILHGFDEEEDLFFDSQLKFHSSWDWLMPVVEKIENLGNQTFRNLGVTSYSRFEIKHNHIKLYWSKEHKYQLFLEVIPKWMSDSSFGISKNQIRINITKEITKIEALWLAVVEFIKWYNLNNK